LPTYAHEKKKTAEKQESSKEKAAAMTQNVTTRYADSKNTVVNYVQSLISKHANSAAVPVEIPHGDKPTSAGEESISLKGPDQEGQLLGQLSKEQRKTPVNETLHKLAVVLSQVIQQGIADQEAAAQGQEAAPVPQNVNMSQSSPQAPATPLPMGMQQAQAPAQPQQPQAGAAPVAAAPAQKAANIAPMPAAPQATQPSAPTVGSKPGIKPIKPMKAEGTSPMFNPIQSYGALSTDGDINGNAGLGIKNSPDSLKTAGIADMLAAVRKGVSTYANRLTGKSILPFERNLRLTKDVADNIHPKMYTRTPQIETLMRGVSDSGVGNAGGASTARSLGGGLSEQVWNFNHAAQRKLWNEQDAIKKTRFGTGLGAAAIAAGIAETLRASRAQNATDSLKSAAANTPCSCGCGDTVTTCKCGPDCKCRKPGGSCCKTTKEKSAALGLWDRIRMKKERGGKPAKPGDKDYPDSKSWKKVTAISEKKAGTPAWQRSAGKNEEGGLNEKGRKSYEREHGGNLKAPVTEKNPKGEAKKRQNSFCSRMCGMKRVNTGASTAKDPDSRINKSLRKWNCKCSSAALFGARLAYELGAQS
jgi:hypothetical protein